MPRRKTPHPTDVELEILQVLWDRGPSSLGEIRAGLRARRNVATSTVATMLGVMLDKGLVSRTRGRRGNYVWSARISHRTATAGMVGRLIDRLFNGSAQRLAAHLVEEGQLTECQWQEIAELVDTGAEPSKRPARKVRQPAEKPHETKPKKTTRRTGKTRS
jgi:predicted transcriptional regulator